MPPGGVVGFGFSIRGTQENLKKNVLSIIQTDDKR